MIAADNFYFRMSTTEFDICRTSIRSVNKAKRGIYRLRWSIANSGPLCFMDVLFVVGRFMLNVFVGIVEGGRIEDDKSTIVCGVWCCCVTAYCLTAWQKPSKSKPIPPFYTGTDQTKEFNISMTNAMAKKWKTWANQSMSRLEYIDNMLLESYWPYCNSNVMPTVRKCKTLIVVKLLTLDADLALSPLVPTSSDSVSVNNSRFEIQSIQCLLQ